MVDVSAFFYKDHVNKSQICRVHLRLAYPKAGLRLWYVCWVSKGGQNFAHDPTKTQQSVLVLTKSGISNMFDIRCGMEES